MKTRSPELEHVYGYGTYDNACIFCSTFKFSGEQGCRREMYYELNDILDVQIMSEHGYALHTVYGKYSQTGSYHASPSGSTESKYVMEKTIIENSLKAE